MSAILCVGICLVWCFWSECGMLRGECVLFSMCVVCVVFSVFVCLCPELYCGVFVCVRQGVYCFDLYL